MTSTSSVLASNSGDSDRNGAGSPDANGKVMVFF
jgi:hypothetical protein